MFLMQKFRKRLGPFRKVAILQAVTDHYAEQGDEEGLAFMEEVRGSRDMRDAFFDEVTGMMSAKQLAEGVNKADGEFFKWLLEFIIANLPAIIALFAKKSGGPGFASAMAVILVALMSLLCFSGSTMAQEPSTVKQKWTYVLLIVKDQPTGKVTQTETFETLTDLHRFLDIRSPSPPNCACGEDCTCVDCKCEKIEKADPNFGAVSEEIRILLGMSRKQYVAYLKTEEGQATLLYPRDREYQLEILRGRKAKKEAAPIKLPKHGDDTYEGVFGNGAYAPKKAKPQLTAVELYLKRQNEIGGASEYGERSNSGGLVGGIKCEKD